MSQTLARPQSEVDIKALTEAHKLTDKAVAIVYFSFSEPDSFVGAHDPGGRITRLIEFLPLPVRGADLLDAIGSIDGNGTRLVANYAHAFPALYGGLVEFYADDLVRGEIPDHSVIAGAPARVVRRYVAGEGWVPPLRHPVDTPDWWIVDRPRGVAGGERKAGKTLRP